MLRFRPTLTRLETRENPDVTPLDPLGGPAPPPADPVPRPPAPAAPAPGPAGADPPPHEPVLSRDETKRPRTVFSPGSLRFGLRGGQSLDGRLERVAAAFSMSW